MNETSKRKSINPLLNFITQSQVAGILGPNVSRLQNFGNLVSAAPQPKTATQQLKSIARKTGEYFLSIDLGCLLEQKRLKQIEKIGELGSKVKDLAEIQSIIYQSNHDFGQQQTTNGNDKFGYENFH